MTFRITNGDIAFAKICLVVHILLRHKLMLGDGGLQVCFSGVLCLRSSLINEFMTSLRHVKYMH